MDTAWRPFGRLDNPHQDPLSFRQGGHVGLLHYGNMYEDILAPVFRLDKAHAFFERVPLDLAEHLDCAGRAPPLRPETSRAHQVWAISAKQYPMWIVYTKANGTSVGLTVHRRRRW